VRRPVELGPAAIAEAALRQLDDLRIGKAGPAFTSDLSVDELLLVTEAGFEPLGLVVGSSIYHVGAQFQSWNKNQELDVLSRAMSSAREFAMNKMQLEAMTLGADGVVGVRLNVLKHDFGPDISEFVAIGTAVKADPRADGRLRHWRTKKGWPFTSNLSGQDFCTLIKAGYAPVGMVIGSCVYHIAHRQLGQVIGNLRRNVEIEQYTEALYAARELAMSRIHKAAKTLAADGIVAVELHQNSHAWGSNTTEFLAIGTAIKPVRGEHEIERPAIVLDLEC
jgi:uncharacterized protein YbjQ (UPF0145 family)